MSTGAFLHKTSYGKRKSYEQSTINSTNRLGAYGRYCFVKTVAGESLDRTNALGRLGLLLWRLGMGNLLRAQITVKGTRPLLCNHFGPDSMPLEKQERTGVAGHDPEEWRKRVLTTKEGQVYLPPTYAFGCLRNASKYTKRGKGSIQTSLVATLQVTTDRILIDRYFPGFPNGHEFDRMTAESPSQDSDQPLYLDVQSVRNPSTKARNIRYRVAASTGWRCSFDLLWDKTIVSRNEMEAVAIDAGKLVGLGDGRSVGFGRFEIEDFRVSEDV